MVWVKAQNDNLIETRAVKVERVKGQKPRLLGGEGDKLAVYTSVAKMEAVMADLERWISGNGKSLFGGRNRVFTFPSDKEV